MRAARPRMLLLALIVTYKFRPVPRGLEVIKIRIVSTLQAGADRIVPQPLGHARTYTAARRDSSTRIHNEIKVVDDVLAVVDQIKDR
jgi:hypothetical protein